MDKRFVFWCVIGVIALFIMTSTSMTNLLLTSFVLGVIPGTNTRVPDWTVFYLSIIIALTLVAWLAYQTIYVGEVVKTPVPSKKPAKSHKKSMRTKQEKPVTKPSKGIA